MVILTSIPGLVRETVSVDLDSVAAGRSLRFEADCRGLKVGMFVKVRPVTALTAGLEVVGADCVTKDKVQVTVINATAAPIDEGAVSFQVFAL